MSGDRTKFHKDRKLIYGLHPEGIFEIKIHDPKKKNAFFLKTMQKFAELFDYANKDDNVKCVVLHGGENFSAGNDVAAFEIGRNDLDNVSKFSWNVLQSGLQALVKAFYDLEKPLVAVVRGIAIGIGFTILSMADFVYCSPDARFFTPFMQSFQSPEGGSTAFFPIIFGPRQANEILLLDKMMNAQEAKKYGYVNEILIDLPKKGDYFDLLKIPCIPKLLTNNVQTMVTAKRLLKQAYREKFFAAFDREAKALHETWTDPKFPYKMMAYLLSINQKQRNSMSNQKKKIQQNGLVKDNDVDKQQQSNDKKSKIDPLAKL